MMPDKPTFTLKEVADRLQVTERWLREFVRRRQIGVLRSGRIVRFDDAAMRELEEAMRVKPRAPLPTAPVAAFRSSEPSKAGALERARNLAITGSRKKRTIKRGQDHYTEALELATSLLRRPPRATSH